LCACFVLLARGWGWGAAWVHSGSRLAVHASLTAASPTLHLASPSPVLLIRRNTDVCGARQAGTNRRPARETNVRQHPPPSAIWYQWRQNGGPCNLDRPWALSPACPCRQGERRRDSGQARAIQKINPPSSLRVLYWWHTRYEFEALSADELARWTAALNSTCSTADDDDDDDTRQPLRTDRPRR